MQSKLTINNHLLSNILVVHVVERYCAHKRAGRLIGKRAHEARDARHFVALAKLDFARFIAVWPLKC